MVNLTEQENKFLANASVKNEDFEKAKIDIKLLMDIAEDYKKFYSDFLQEAEYIAKKLQRSNAVHSVRWRVKDVGHLIEKIVRKRCEEKVAKKYQDISVENYKSVITDLIGVRAIHLFKDDWEDVHQHILSNWKPNERITVYFREGDNISMFVGHKCKTVRHKAGYRSIHYIIPVNKIDNNKVACEIQTRTLFEEGWSEIDHRVRYPNFLDDDNLKKYLDIFNRLAGSADEMGSYVNSLVGLININRDYFLNINKLEEKIDKLLVENAEVEKIKNAFDELKYNYKIKEELLNQNTISLRNSSKTLSYISFIMKLIRELDIDVNSISIKEELGSYVRISDINDKTFILPRKYIGELEKNLNVKIKIE